MPLTCLYSLANHMRVVDGDEIDRLVATGEWFYTRKEANEQLEKLSQQIKEEDEEHERQIRRKPRKRRSNGEDSSQADGS